MKAAAEKAGVEIISINALYPFNVWSGDLPARAVALADYAKAAGAKALVMCPLNDGTPVSHADLVAALKAMAPILRERGLDRPRRAARLPDLVDAHQAAGGRRRSTRRAARDVYRLVHDTFHHHLAGETEFFPERTGIVHISGVVDPDVAVDEMLDPHRVLVDDADRLENVPQIRRARRPRLRRPVQLRAVRAGGARAGRSGGRAPREHGARDRGADGADRGLRPGRQVRRAGSGDLT